MLDLLGDKHHRSQGNSLAIAGRLNQYITDQGTIIAEHVVNPAGCFAREVGAMVGVNVPIVSLEHQYLVTDPLPAVAALDRGLPVCRDSCTESYIRQEGNGLLIGLYETFGSKLWALGGMDWNFDRELFEPGLERLMPFLDRCMEVMSAFGEVGSHTVINGPIAHTPDDNPLVGPQADLPNLWNLCRFGDWADRQYCTTKAIEAYENMYTPAAPNDNRPHARPARHSPLYGLLAQKGCVHGVANGYKKPLWFQTDQVRAETISWTHSEAHQVAAEKCYTVQHYAGIIDLYGASKYVVRGKDASVFLDQLSANKLPARDERLGLTLLHASNGGILAEMSVTRINAEHYYLNSGIAPDLKKYDLLASHIGELDVTVENVAQSTGAMLVTGPESLNIISQLTEDDLSNQGLRWLSAKTVKIDSAEVLVMRVSYAGEPGYELHMPGYKITSIYESLMWWAKNSGFVILVATHLTPCAWRRPTGPATMNLQKNLMLLKQAWKDLLNSPEPSTEKQRLIKACNKLIA